MSSLKKAIERNCNLSIFVTPSLTLVTKKLGFSPFSSFGEKNELTRLSITNNTID
jgi:hypothetical protein